MRLASISLPALPLIMLVMAACPGTAQTDAATSESSSSATDSESSGPDTTAESESETETGDEPACAGQTPAELMDCVDQARYEDDLQFVAEVRNPGSPHWQAVQDLCFDRLTELGYAVELQDYGTGVNVIGTRPAPQRPRLVLGPRHPGHLHQRHRRVPLQRLPLHRRRRQPR